MNPSPSPAPDPIAQFHEWSAAAERGGVLDPTAMAVATAGADGLPNVRVVLLKGADARGFVFYTNLDSPKAVELAANPHAALCFYWPQIQRQVRVAGPADPVTAAEADAYFATRPRLSQLGAWASHQSRPLAGRFELERNCAAAALRFGVGPVSRPPHWSGFRVVPATIEFWQEQPFRLHERIRYTRTPGGWVAQPIFP